MLTPFDLLMTQAARLFNGDVSATDAPIRSLLTLILAPALIAIGAWQVFAGLRWMRNLRVAPGGPAALEREEVIATLTRREPPAFGAGPRPAYWPLRRWLADQLADLPWWQRDVMSRGVKAFVRACVLVLTLAALYGVRPVIIYDDLLGPFPLSFVVELAFATGIWAALSLLLIPSNEPRIEPFAFELPLVGGTDREHLWRRAEAALVDSSRIDSANGELLIESRPAMLPRDPPALGRTIGLAGVAVQLLLPSWWTLSYVGYPLMATSINRHAGAIAAGVVFFVLGSRMIATGAELLLTFRYESTLVVLRGAGERLVGHAAAVRTVSRGLIARRHVVAAVADSTVREIAPAIGAKIADRVKQGGA